MKKIYVGLFILLIAIVGLTSVACTKKKSESDSTKTAGEKTRIQFWHVFGDENRGSWIQEKADEWNVSQDKYILEPETKGTYRETLNASILATRQKQGPHLVHIFEVGSQLALDSQIFISVEDIGKFDSSDYISSVLNYYTLEGVVNSIPFNSSSPVLYYNEDLMKQAGIDTDNPPRTLEEVITYSEIAQKKGMHTAGFGFNLHGWFFEQWIAQQGAMLANNDNGRTARATEVLLKSPALVRTLTLIKELNDKGLYKYTGKLEDWSGSEAIFTSGEVMFHMSSTADVGNVAQAVEGKFKLGTGYMPIPSGERNGTVIGGGSVWITKDHPQDELEAAQDFLLYMTNTENMAEWHKLTGYYPVRLSSIDLLEKEGWFEEHPETTISFEQLQATKTNAATAGALIGSFLDTRTILEEAVQQVLNGEEIASALDEASKKANSKLQEYNQNIE